MREIYKIAEEIGNDWQPMSIHARPYYFALCQLRTLDDFFHLDTAASCVAYFLSNAAGWRGEVARRVKQELRDGLAEHWKRNEV